MKISYKDTVRAMSIEQKIFAFCAIAKEIDLLQEDLDRDLKYKED